MKKFFAIMFVVLSLIFSLSGCNTVGDKNVSVSIIYGADTILSFVLLIGCLFSVRKNKIWFHVLFSSVLVVNIGYTLLSVSSDLEMALWANRVSYLGSVFLPFSMLMIILNVTNTPFKKELPRVLFIISILVFLVAASPGILDIYYKEVTFEVVNGVSKLVKVYGLLHPLYMFYLFGYFSVMVIVIIRAQIKKTIDTTTHAVILAISVFVNIGVWFIEQLVSIDFEMLSISYIISELFLLGVHLVMSENQKLREIVKQVESVQSYSEERKTDVMLENPIEIEAITPERIETFMAGLKEMTPTEKTIYEAYIARATTKEIMANLNIKENTLKYHNRNIYGKLGVSSRKELLETHKYIKSMKTKFEDAIKN